MNRFYKLILYTVGDAVAIRLTVKLLSLVPQIILFLLTMLLSAYLLSSDSKHLGTVPDTFCRRCGQMIFSPCSAA